MLCFAGENVSRKMDEEGLPRDGCKTRSARGGSCSDRPRSGTASSGVVIRNLNSQNLRSVSHESFVFTPSTSQILRDISHESFVFTSSTFIL